MLSILNFSCVSQEKYVIAPEHITVIGSLVHLFEVYHWLSWFSYFLFSFSCTGLQDKITVLVVSLKLSMHSGLAL